MLPSTTVFLENLPMPHDITSFKWFSPERICSKLIQLASYSLMIQGQQSFAQQKDKVVACEWRYKHSLTSLECYEYASKTKQLRDTVIVGHAFTNVSLTIMMLPLAYFRPFSVCGLFTACWNYLYLSWNLYHPWMDVTIKCNFNQEQARRMEEL